MILSIRRSCAVALCCVLTMCAGLVLSPAAGADAVQRGQWYLAKLGVRAAWQHTKGNGVVVGVVDSGVDGTIADLRGSVAGGKDFSGAGSANGQKPIPPNTNHGTNVASLIAGHGHGAGHTDGILGTAPGAKLLSASFQTGSSDDHSEDAIRWLADHGAKVINVSFVSVNQKLKAAVEYAQSKDVVVVAGTGNTLTGYRHGLSLPAAFPGVVAVTGVDEDLRSDPGATIGPGTRIAAPFSTHRTSPLGHKNPDGLPVANPRSDPSGPYMTDFGTSLSTAIVSGVVALIRAQYPKMDAANVVNRLIRTATPEGGQRPNSTYGYGVVNAKRAVTAKVATVTANPLGTLVPTSAQSPGPSASSPAPSTSATESRSSRSPATVVPPAASSQAAAGSSSGLGAGAVVAIIVAIVIVGGLVAWLLARNRQAGPPSRT